MPFEKLTSLQNPKIKFLRQLRERKTRDESGQTLIEGVREIHRAFDGNIVLETAFICPEHLQDQSIMDVLSKHQVHIVEVSQEVHDKIAFGDRSEGILAIAKQPQWDVNQLLLKENPLIVILEGVQKPGNLGAILRTCDAAGVDAVFIHKAQTDIFNPNVIRASLGAIFTRPVLQVSDEELMHFLKTNHIQCYPAFVERSAEYSHCDFTPPSALVLGSEDKGLSDFWQKDEFKPIHIPQFGCVDSLNVSVSAAILIYEAVRQRLAK